jgi:hypothetical protein
MAPADYMSSLVSLVQNPTDKMRRKALNLISSSVKASVTGANDAVNHGDEALSVATLQACDMIAALLAAGSPGETASVLTQQIALSTLGSIALAYGGQNPAPVLLTLPAVLQRVAQSQAAVQASALATLAAITQALGVRMVGPQLPALIQTTLDVAIDVVKQMQIDRQSGSVVASGEKTLAAKASQAHALQLAAALTAVSSLMDNLCSFLAPQLPRLLELLLHPCMLTCSLQRAAELAAGVRGKLAASMPPRLLLNPLMEHLKATVQVGVLCAPKTPAPMHVSIRLPTEAAS